MLLKQLFEHDAARRLEIVRRMIATCALFRMVAAIALQTGECASPLGSCSLNGACTSGGVCVCDAGWTSSNCSVLDLAPAPAAFNAYETNFSSWGGNAIKDPSTGHYHLFFSEMALNGLHSFKNVSQLTTAVSLSGLLGPYDVNRTVLRASGDGRPISHNVQPQMTADGAIYIFMITSQPTPQQQRDDAPKVPFPLSTIVGRAPRLGAPFEWATPRLLSSNGTLLLRDNPSAIVYDNGTVLMVTRGTSLFRAESWRGPYVELSASLFPCGDNACKVEDPFFWQSKRGFHMLMHDHEPFAYHKQVLTYGYTTDVSAQSGWVFSYIEAANGTELHFDDGSTRTFCSRQRPQLYFDALPHDGVQVGKAIALFSGAQHGPLTDVTSECGHGPAPFNPYDDYSFTFVQPLGSTPE